MSHGIAYSFRPLLFCLAGAAVFGGVDVEKLAQQCEKGQLRSCDRLIAVATTDKDSHTRMAAVHWVRDQAVLARIVRTDGNADVRAAAVEMLEDQVLLAETAKADRSYMVRREAVGRLTDQKVCAEIARTDNELIVRRAAVGRLTDQALLVSLTKSALQKDLIEMAVERLTAPDAMAEVARTAASPSLRTLAVARLMDKRQSDCRGAGGLESLLSGAPVNASAKLFFSHDPDPDVRDRIETEVGHATGSLVRFIESQSAPKSGAAGVTLEVLAFGSAKTARYQVVGERWTSAKWLGAMSLSTADRCVWSGPTEFTMDPFLSVRRKDDAHQEPKNAPFAMAIDRWLGMAVSRLVENSGGQHALAGLAQMEGSRDCISQEALKKITDQALLSRIALSAASADVASDAVLRMTDQDALTAIARTTASRSSVRREAVKRISDRKLLAELSKGDPDPDIRSTAGERLKEFSEPH